MLGEATQDDEARARAHEEEGDPTSNASTSSGEPKLRVKSLEKSEASA